MTKVTIDTILKILQHMVTITIDNHVTPYYKKKINVKKLHLIKFPTIHIQGCLTPTEVF